MSVSNEHKAHYSPPWADTSIIGIAGSSGSGKTSLAVEIVSSLNLPWVVILSMDSFYKSLTSEQAEKAFRNEFDFDSPDAIDFDTLVERLKDLKQGQGPLIRHKTTELMMPKEREQRFQPILLKSISGEIQLRAYIRRMSLYWKASLHFTNLRSLIY
ncbi:Uridine kinase [Acarospora aff. strigata]|nr:Uridine kinase [Acarospora aff. strigata]